MIFDWFLVWERKRKNYKEHFRHNNCRNINMDYLSDNIIATTFNFLVWSWYYSYAGKCCSHKILKRLCVCVCARVHQQRDWGPGVGGKGGKGRRESEADSILRTEPNVQLYPTAARSGPEPKPRVGHLPDWATQSPQDLFILERACKHWGGTEGETVLSRPHA